jgi:hypothetical protein
MDDVLMVDPWEPLTLNLVMRRGADFDPDFEWADDNGPLDWTGYGAELVIVVGAATLTKTQADGITLAADGGMQWSITRAEVDALPVGTGTCRLWATEPGGARRPLGSGTVRVVA